MANKNPKSKANDPEIESANLKSEEPEISNTAESDPIVAENDSMDDEKNILENKVQDLEEKYLRLHADFDNFRRRNAKERLELIQNASQSLITELLPVLDDFERSIKAMESADKSVKEGVELVSRKLLKVLENKGLSKMKCMGEDFDSELHEAITQIPAPKEKQKGKILDVVEDGYLLNEKVIRFAKVVIGQ